MKKLKNLHKIIFATGFAVTTMLFLLVILPGHFAAVNSERWKTADDQAVTFAVASSVLNIQSNYPSVEYDTDRPGGDYSDFDLPQADFELCRKACAGDANCKAYTYVKPGVQGSNARCWLKSSIPTGGQSSCCISGIRINKGKKDSSAETDLSGTWHAVVNSNEGRWDYAMSLQLQSAGKWTGTLTITLDGKSPSTTEAAVESAGGGRITMIWRPGKPNAQSFEGTATKDRINIAGYGGQITFTRR